LSIIDCPQNSLVAGPQSPVIRVAHKEVRSSIKPTATIAHKFAVSGDRRSRDFDLHVTFRGFENFQNGSRISATRGGMSLTFFGLLVPYSIPPGVLQ
jgi:hypothetical protein